MKYFLIFLAFHVLSISAFKVKFTKPDEFLTTKGLLRRYGYPCETHKVITEDGYILQHFRIPHGKSNSHKTGKRVVLLQHGFMGSSNHWLLQNPSHSLGYILADAGYDVWLMNTRGNTYSSKHIEKHKKSDYWDFSWNEVGIYDIPNTIDYVTNVTKQNQVYHVGHCQGTTSMYVLLSEKPHYKNKLIAHLSYSPTAFIGHASSILFTSLIPFEKYGLLTILRLIFGDFNYIPEHWLLKLTPYLLCQPFMPTRHFCNLLMYSASGYSPNELNSTSLPILLGNIPAGSAFKQAVHYVQLMISGKFQKYDNGKSLNMNIYGTLEPPEYDINNIQVPIYAFYGKTDVIAPQVDVEKFLSKLPYLVKKYDMGECSHEDYLVSNTVAKRIYSETLEILKESEVELEFQAETAKNCF